jgi:hypothetical protein
MSAEITGLLDNMETL